jgi:hypothetical protein
MYSYAYSLKSVITLRTIYCNPTTFKRTLSKKLRHSMGVTFLFIVDVHILWTIVLIK